MRVNYPLLLALAALPLPVPVPSSWLCSALPAVFPAIQAAISKFCSGFAVLVPPLNMLFFCCSSNSAFISGSTNHPASQSQRACSPKRGVGRRGKGVLFSNRYGIPKTNPSPTIAINIIGFLSKLNGETTSPNHTLASSPTDISSRRGITHTHSSLHNTP